MSLTGPFCALSSYHRGGQKLYVRLSEEDIQAALKYFYKTATKEAEDFNKPELIAGIGMKKD